MKNKKTSKNQKPEKILQKTKQKPKTQNKKQEQIKRETHIIDAEGKTLGRLAVEIANLLRGKHKPIFYYHKDVGDYVVVKNVDKMHFSGKKLEKKLYRWHTGYLGGLKEIKLKDLLKKNPKKVLQKAVYNMLPKNRLRKKFLKRLRFE